MTCRGYIEAAVRRQLDDQAFAHLLDELALLGPRVLSSCDRFSSCRFELGVGDLGLDGVLEGGECAADLQR